MRFLKFAAVALLCSTAAASAQSGSGPVYQFLQRQGYTQIHTVRDRARMQIRITAQRGELTRELVYDGRTGKLLWDSLDPDRDRTRDRIYLHDFDRDRDRLRDQDRMHDRSSHK